MYGGRAQRPNDEPVERKRDADERKNDANIPGTEKVRDAVFQPFKSGEWTTRV